MIAIKGRAKSILDGRRRCNHNAVSIRNLSVRAMVDHIARADELRKRAVQCRLVAKEMTSTKFEECCGKLADHYVALADMEEGFARRTAALRQATNEALLTGLT